MEDGVEGVGVVLRDSIGDRGREANVTDLINHFTTRTHFKSDTTTCCFACVYSIRHHQINESLCVYVHLCKCLLLLHTKTTKQIRLFRIEKF